MTVPVQKVQPGDLITAAFVNGLIDQLALLDGRITALEGVVPGRTMQIFSPLPSDTFHIGAELRVVGQGFGLPQLDSVTFDGTTRVTSFKVGSSDNLLILDIPNFIIPPQGKVVTLSVTNSTGFAQTTFTVLPPVATVPTGQLFLTQTPAPAQTVQPPFIDLFYMVSAAVTVADTYTFTPQFTNAAAGWDAFLADAQNNRLSPDFPIGAQASVPIHVRVAVPGIPTGSSAGLTINFGSKNNGTTVRSATTGIITLTVGSAVPGNEKIALTRGIVADSQGIPLAPDGQGVYPLPIARAPANFFFTVSAPPGAPAANYTAVASLDAAAVGWPAQAAKVVDPPGGKLVGLAGQKQIQVTVSPQSGAQATSFTVKVTADADATNVTGHITLPIRAV